MRWYSCDTVTGESVQPLDQTKGSWSIGLGDADDVKVSLSTAAEDDFPALWNRTSELTRSVVVEVGESLIAGGPVWLQDGSLDGSSIDVTTKGMRQLFDRIPVLPPAALTRAVSSWYVPDPADADKFIPAAEVVTSLSGFDLGTIAKKIVQQTEAWPGGGLPIAYQDDRAGSHERNYIGPEFPSVGDMLEDLENVEGGPDIRFTPRWRSSGRAVEWLMETGTESKPLLSSDQVQTWDMTAAEPSVRNVRVRSDASGVGSVAWGTAGHTSGQALIARRYSPKLPSLGFPLLHIVDRGRSNVEYQSTLDSYAGQNLAAGAGSKRTWSFEVQADRAPIFGTYRVGDFARLRVPTGPEGAGTYEMRIVGLSGEFGSDWVTVSCDPGRRVDG